MIDIELFAGAGGMALGLHAAGFGPSLLHEVDPHACETLRLNEKGGADTSIWSVHEGDVHQVKWTDVAGPVRLLAAGAPCQPFSLGGKHAAHGDDRNLFPQIFSAMRVLSPACVMLENVRGLLRESFLPYWEYILAQLRNPSIAIHKDESWKDHYKRIKKHRALPNQEDEYLVTWKLVDAADFGVPQNRLRVLIVATRADLPLFRFPTPTHSRRALVRAQADGTYWTARGLKRGRPLHRLEQPELEIEDNTLPWMTVRDAIHGLPTPADCEDNAINSHWSIPGARSYKGHLGSPIDWPSKTIKAGVHGVPGGENTLQEGNDRVRYYTLREAARLQTFPDTHRFSGRRLHVTRQIGNAVPARLAEIVGRQLYTLLETARGETTQPRMTVAATVAGLASVPIVSGNFTHARTCDVPVSLVEPDLRTLLIDPRLVDANESLSSAKRWNTLS